MKIMSDTLIRDNKNYGSVGEFLKDVIREGSDLSVVRNCQLLWIEV